MATWLFIFMIKRDLFVAPSKNKLLFIIGFSVFTDYTTRSANGMSSEWSYKNQNSSNRGKFQWTFDQGKGNFVRVRVNRVKLTKKWGEIQGKWDILRVSREFELSEFELSKF